MSHAIITQIIEQVNDLPDDLQQQVLTFISTLRQKHLQTSSNAWDVLESLWVQSKPLPIGQPSIIIIFTAHLNIRKMHDG